MIKNCEEIFNRTKGQKISKKLTCSHTLQKNEGNFCHILPYMYKLRQKGKYFVRFLVDMRTKLFVFEIFWPVANLIMSAFYLDLVSMP